MSDQFQTNPPPAPPPAIIREFPPLPIWLLPHVLKDDEQITWIRGPKFNPWWERYTTHPLLIVPTLLLAGLVLLVVILAGGTEPHVFGPFFLGASILVVGTIFVMAITAGYFTRLIVTDQKIVIMQGYEVCRQWSVNDLPRSMLRYRLHDDGKRSPTIDLNTLQTMLGPQSGQYTESKTILAFAKQLDSIKTRDDRQP